MIKNVLVGLVLGLTLGTATQAVAMDNRVDIRNRLLYVDTDWTHDLVSFSVDPQDSNVLVIKIAQFVQEPDIFSFSSEQEALDLADRSRVERRNMDRFDLVIVRVFEGNDAVQVQSSLTMPFVIAGGDGDDYLSGGAGDDTIWGDGDPFDPFGTGAEAGEDTLFGFGGQDYLKGGPLDDQLDGGTGDDHLSGNSGDDDLFGQAGKDYLSGGLGEDFLDGGYDGEVDVLRGDTGADSFVDKRIRIVSELVTVFVRNKWQTRIRKRTVTLEKEDTVDFDQAAGDQYKNEIVE